MYLVGAGVFAVAIGALLFSRCNDDKPAKDPTPVATVTSAAPEPQPALPEYAPPPPPDEEPEGEGGKKNDTKKPEPGPKTAAGPASGSRGGACSACGQGQASGALKTAVAQTMGLARGCYNRALRGNAGEGRIVVSVSVGSDGTLCGANLASNTTGNAALGSCVLGKFKARSYPPPQSGCVVVNAPINFSMKQ